MEIGQNFVEILCGKAGYASTIYKPNTGEIREATLPTCTKAVNWVERWLLYEEHAFDEQDAEERKMLRKALRAHAKQQETGRSERDESVMVQSLKLRRPTQSTRRASVQEPYGDELSPIARDGLFGYAKDGETVLAPQWESADPFGLQNLARVRQNGKYGFIYPDGSYAIEPQWDNAQTRFYEDRAAVCRDGRWGFINMAGDVVIPLEWDSVQQNAFYQTFVTHSAEAQEGTLEALPAAVCRQGKWGFINRRGDILLEPRFEEISGGMSLVFHWWEDGAAREIRAVSPGGNPALFITAPVYLSAKKNGRWHRVQMGVDGRITAPRGRYPQ